MSEVRHQRPLVLSRYGGLGNHRSPIGFSGDTLRLWDTLDFEVRTLNTEGQSKAKERRQRETERWIKKVREPRHSERDKDRETIERQSDMKRLYTTETEETKKGDAKEKDERLEHHSHALSQFFRQRRLMCDHRTATVLPCTQRAKLNRYLTNSPSRTCPKVYMTPRASNVLFGYWSHDIGGFSGGCVDAQVPFQLILLTLSAHFERQSQNAQFVFIQS